MGHQNSMRLMMEHLAHVVDQSGFYVCDQCLCHTATVAWSQVQNAAARLWCKSCQLFNSVSHWVTSLFDWDFRWDIRWVQKYLLRPKL